jgi:hypothetical protein
VHVCARRFGSTAGSCRPGTRTDLGDRASLVSRRWQVRIVLLNRVVKEILVNSSLDGP